MLPLLLVNNADEPAKEVAQIIAVTSFTHLNLQKALVILAPAQSLACIVAMRTTIS